MHHLKANELPVGWGRSFGGYILTLLPR